VVRSIRPNIASSSAVRVRPSFPSLRRCRATVVSRLWATVSLHLPEQPLDHGLQVPVLLEVDQEFAEGPRLRVAPVGADGVGAVEVREPQDVDELGATGCRASRRARTACAISSKITGGG
jgi:hypothetical protein